MLILFALLPDDLLLQESRDNSMDTIETYGQREWHAEDLFSKAQISYRGSQKEFLYQL